MLNQRPELSPVTESIEQINHSGSPNDNSIPDSKPSWAKPVRGTAIRYWISLFRNRNAPALSEIKSGNSLFTTIQSQSWLTPWPLNFGISGYELRPFMHALFLSEEF